MPGRGYLVLAGTEHARVRKVSEGVDCKGRFSVRDLLTKRLKNGFTREELWIRRIDPWRRRNKMGPTLKRRAQSPHALSKGGGLDNLAGDTRPTREVLFKRKGGLGAFLKSQSQLGDGGNLVERGTVTRQPPRKRGRISSSERGRGHQEARHRHGRNSFKRGKRIERGGPLPNRTTEIERPSGDLGGYKTPLGEESRSKAR